MSDKTVVQLLQLVDKGLDLQIPDTTKDGDFLENLGDRIREESLKSFQIKIASPYHLEHTIIPYIM